jgi:hypothetical protein
MGLWLVVYIASNDCLDLFCLSGLVAGFYWLYLNKEYRNFGFLPNKDILLASKVLSSQQSIFTEVTVNIEHFTCGEEGTLNKLRST